jgi:hypothetical protein
MSNFGTWERKLSLPGNFFLAAVSNGQVHELGVKKRSFIDEK